jgi:NAD(P)-dependent dehydrogenase (short-subunit alcohol dehydrogenase family)
LRIDRRGQQPVDHGLLALLGRLAGRALDPDNPHLHGRYDPWRAYGQSKLADVHFTLELDRRFRAAGLPAKSIVVHPGFTNTDLQAPQRPRDRWRPEPAVLPRRRPAVRDDPGPGRPPAAAAATDPGAPGGALYTPRWGPPVRRPLFRRSRNRDAMATLWAVSERETGIRFDIKLPS